MIDQAGSSARPDPIRFCTRRLGADHEALSGLKKPSAVGSRPLIFPHPAMYRQECSGLGYEIVEMQFLSDLQIPAAIARSVSRTKC